jgi:hypothetical protein
VIPCGNHAQIFQEMQWGNFVEEKFKNQKLNILQIKKKKQ